MTTTSRAMLEQLRDRLRAATGPDRELDESIAILALGWRRSTNPNLGAVLETPSGVYETGAPRFTDNLHVALALVPDGWEWTVSNRARPPHAGRAYIHNRELIYTGMSGMVRNPKHQSAECTAATPALGLCLARIEFEIARQP